MYGFGSRRGRRCGGDRIRGLGLDFTNPVETGECGTCFCV